MKQHRDSVIGTEGGPEPGSEYSNVSITRRDKTWYLHIPPKYPRDKNIWVKSLGPYKIIRLMRTGEKLQATHRNGRLMISCPPGKQHDVIEIVWKD